MSELIMDPPLTADAGFQSLLDLVRLRAKGGHSAETIRAQVSEILDTWPASLRPTGDVVDGLIGDAIDRVRNPAVDLPEMHLQNSGKMSDISDTTPAEWPAVVPLDGYRSPPSINLDKMIPNRLGWYRDYCREVSDSVGAAPDWPAALGLGVASLAAAGAYEVVVKPGYSEPPALWFLGVAPPSHRKSPAFTLATAPLREWEKDTAKALRPLLANYRTARATMEKRLIHLQTKASKADGDGVGPIMEDLGKATLELSEMPDLQAPCLTTTDATPESLGDLIDRNGGPVGIVDDEGAAVACLLGRYGEDGARVELANKGYSATPATVTRKGKDPMVLERPELAMALAAQPAVLASIGGNGAAVGRGFLARFLIIRPDAVPGGDRWDTEAVSPDLTASYRKAIRRILEVPRPGRLVETDSGKLVRATGDRIRITLSADAVAIARPFYGEVAARRVEGGDMDDPHGWTGKLRGNVFRIALALHLLADGGPMIDGPTMEAAVAWSDYLHRHFIAAMGEISEPSDVHHARRLIAALGRRGKLVMTARDMFKLVLDSALPDMDAFRPVLDLLTEHGAIRPRQPLPGKPGRPAEQYEIHPDLVPFGVLSDSSDKFPGIENEKEVEQVQQVEDHDLELEVVV